MSVLDFALLAAGRGDTPSDSGGILIIAGIVMAAIVGGLILHMLFVRFGRNRHDATRRPHRPGRVGRSSEFRS